MASPPFTIATTVPADADVESAFPAVERTYRDVVNSWLGLISDSTTGALKASAMPTPLLTSTVNSAAAGPIAELYRNRAVGVANDAIGDVSFTANNGSGNKVEFANLHGGIVDPVAATEDGEIVGELIIAGSAAQRCFAIRQDFTGFGPNANTGYFLGRNDDDGYLELQGGNVSTDGKFRAYSAGHATQARDLEMYSNNSLIYQYDFSAGFHQFNGTVFFPNTIRLTQNSTDNPGIGNNTQGLGFVAATSRMCMNANGAAHAIGRAQDGAIVAWCSTGSSQGSVAIAGAVTSYNTSSDERLKNFIGIYDPEKAIAIIRADPVRDFIWNQNTGRAAGGYAVGWSAQHSHSVSPDLATPGHGEIGAEDFMPWGMDQGKRTPYLWAAMSNVLDRLEALEQKGDTNAH